MSSGLPSKPIEAYPKADLGDLPQPPAPSDAPAPAGSAASAAAGPAARAEAAPHATVLQFLDPAAVRATVPLQFPFMLDGSVVREIPVHRLSGAEVGAVADANLASVELFDFYAAMSGYPKAVLRGLIDDDLEAFLDKARPFLCPFARTFLLRPTGESGAPSPDAPAGPSASPGPAS